MRLPSWIPSVVCVLAAGCIADADRANGEDKDFSSNQATLLDFEFDAELVTDASFDDEQTIQDQLLYTVGHLNHDRSVGRLDALELSNVVREDENGRTKIRYHAKLPVAWASKTSLPKSYEFRIPRDIGYGALQGFAERHKSTCVDWGAHDVDAGSMWYYYRPLRQGCRLDETEVVRFTARVTKSAENSTDKYPELHKIWEDNRLEMIAIFGKYEDGAVTGDAGIEAYAAFVSAMADKLGSMDGYTTSPATLPSSPGVESPEVSFEARLSGGKSVKVTALLVDNIRTAGAAFDARYEALSPRADLIAYNGHAGLGQNVRALARKGRFVPGQYQIFFMNGCDTFAYVDGSLAETRSQLNGEDPTGTKYMEFVTNAMPSFFSSMPYASMALFEGLLHFESPKTYDGIFEDIDRSEVVLVTGEEDNVFRPGMPIGNPSR